MSRRDTTDMHPTTDPAAAAEHGVGLEPAPRTRLRAMGDSLSAAVGVALGIAPHVLHHIGLIAGAALVTGTGGNLLFFALGLLFSIPLLRRLSRKFHTWRAPAIALVVFHSPARPLGVRHRTRHRRYLWTRPGAVQPHPDTNREPQPASRRLISGKVRTRKKRDHGFRGGLTHGGVRGRPSATTQMDSRPSNAHLKSDLSTKLTAVINPSDVAQANASTPRASASPARGSQYWRRTTGLLWLRCNAHHPEHAPQPHRQARNSLEDLSGR